MKSEALRQRVETWLLAVWFGYPRGWQKRIYRLAWPILNQLSKLVDREARRRALKVERLPGSARPAVIVVGNLVVGGSGKTPMVIALARLLTAQGLKVGLLARGYRARGNQVPRLIDARTSPDEAGDEALLLAQTGLPVAVGSRRREALELLCSTHTGLDVVISDDGLQHAALPRTLELVMMHPMGLGNGHCLPAGPLREPIERLNTVDALLLPEALMPAARADLKARGLLARDDGHDRDEVGTEGASVSGSNPASTVASGPAMAPTPSSAPTQVSAQASTPASASASAPAAPSTSIPAWGPMAGAPVSTGGCAHRTPPARSTAASMTTPAAGRARSTPPARPPRAFGVRTETGSIHPLGQNPSSTPETPETFVARHQGQTLAAVAGISRPERFFGSLRKLGLDITKYPLPDHARISPEWLASLPEATLIMTAKDAVKCQDFPDVLKQRCWVLDIEAVPEPALLEWLLPRLGAAAPAAAGTSRSS